MKVLKNFPVGKTNPSHNFTVMVLRGNYSQLRKASLSKTHKSKEKKTKTIYKTYISQNLNSTCIKLLKDDESQKWSKEIRLLKQAKDNSKRMYKVKT